MRWSPTPLVLWMLLSACGPGAPRPEPPPSVSPTMIITVVGTNDLHGHVRALPILAGYLRILRDLRAQGSGAVVLLDGGDMFQGTLESNLLEGAPVVEAYAALGYDAVTIGNHEFDYGPVGPRATPTQPGDERRGALLARAAQAQYPFLAANLRMADGAPIAWDHVRGAVILRRGGLRIGVIGVTTEQTLSTTNHANVDDLSMWPVARALTEQAAALRARGAQLVLVAAHAGGRCTEHTDPHDLSSCEADQEIFEVADALPEGTVDAIVAGHTHRSVSHFVHGIPVIESYAYGRAFGRVDLRVERATGRIVERTVHPPRGLCQTGSAGDGDCAPGSYEGRTVEPDARVQALLTPAIENAREMRARRLGVTLEDPITATRERECALGNLFTDLMLEAHGGDVALTNGGGLRADLPAGALTYGQLYEASPFDNVYATVSLSRSQLERMIAENLQRAGSFYSLSGVRAEVTCEQGTLQVHVTRADGAQILDDEVLTLVTTDFLATGDHGAFSELRARGQTTVETAPDVRESMAEVLQERGGTLSAAALYDPEHPRVRYAGTRPLSCTP